MITSGFSLAKIPPIYFGAGNRSLLPEKALLYGNRILLLTGKRSLEKSGFLGQILDGLTKSGITCFHEPFSGEPSPEAVDSICDRHRGNNISVVVAIGGGSVVDCGKAVSAMLPHKNSVFEHLEKVGPQLPHSGIKTPYIAIPTTSGTGSEVTKNAVISRIGPDGFKRSLRHDNFMPDTVIVDPELTLSCSRKTTAYCGMDAFSQLLEAYVSTAANPFTDALCWSGLEKINASFIRVCGTGSDDIQARSDMAYAALLSGTGLANAGLGVIHGVGGPIGGFFDIPHGLVCGTLLGSAIQMNVEVMLENDRSNPAVKKYARVGGLFNGSSEKSDEYNCRALTTIINGWTSKLKIPLLGKYGVKEVDIEKTIQAGGNKNNPIPLSHKEIKTFILRRL